MTHVPNLDKQMEWVRFFFLPLKFFVSVRTSFIFWGTILFAALMFSLGMWKMYLPPLGTKADSEYFKDRLLLLQGAVTQIPKGGFQHAHAILDINIWSLLHAPVVFFSSSIIGINMQLSLCLLSVLSYRRNVVELLIPEMKAKRETEATA